MTSFSIVDPVSGDVYDFGIISRVSSILSKSASVTPLTTYSSDRTFVMETGSSKRYTLDFYRKHPADWIAEDDLSRDSKVWSNAFWSQEIMKLADRWQARFNGYEGRLSADSNPMVPDLDLSEGLTEGSSSFRVYIENISLTQKEGHPDSIFGNITFKIGKSIISAESGDVYNSKIEVLDTRVSIPDSDAFVIMTDAANVNSFELQRGKLPEHTQDGYNNSNLVDCIDSYEVVGGPEQPFESATINISHRKLSELYPSLTNGEPGSGLSNSIEPGANKVYLHGIGNTTMVVSNCKQRSGEYTITAHSVAERIKEAYISTEDLVYTPLAMIRYILSSGRYGVRYITGDIICNIKNDLNVSLTLAAGVSVWSALQVCAMLLGAKIYFSEGKAYVISFLNPPITYKPIELNPRTESGIGANVVGDIELGNEGLDTVFNTIPIRTPQGVEDYVKSGAASSHSSTDLSIKRYGVRRAPEHDLSKIFKNVAAEPKGYDPVEYTTPSEINVDWAGDMPNEISIVYSGLRWQNNTSLGTYLSDTISLSKWDYMEITVGDRYTDSWRYISLYGVTDSDLARAQLPDHRITQDHDTKFCTVTNGGDIELDNLWNASGRQYLNKLQVEFKIPVRIGEIHRGANDEITRYDQAETILRIVVILEEEPYETLSGADAWRRLSEIYASNFLSYLDEPQESITFTMKEKQRIGAGSGYTETEWYAAFPSDSSIKEITSEKEGIRISDDSCLHEGRRPSKLSISTYVRKYPEGVSEYTFGRAINADLSQFVSNVNAKLN